MKPLILFFSALCLMLAGCDSVSERVHDRFSAPVPKSQVFNADERATFEAAKAALKDIGFGYAHGGPAQGRLEALSAVQTGGDMSLDSTRQLQLTAHFSAAPDGGTQVDVVIHEMQESDSDRSAGLATSTPLHDSAVYGLFFQAIGQRLAHPQG